MSDELKQMLQAMDNARLLLFVALASKEQKAFLRELFKQKSEKEAWQFLIERKEECARLFA